MRALILSDIHANIDALDAVLEGAPQHDVVWNLGDVVGYNAAPQAVIERVREIGSPRRVFVRGNHDRACAGLRGAEHFNSVAFRAVQWTQGQLDSGIPAMVEGNAAWPCLLSHWHRCAKPA